MRRLPAALAGPVERAAPLAAFLVPGRLAPVALPLVVVSLLAAVAVSGAAAGLER